MSAKEPCGRSGLSNTRYARLLTLNHNAFRQVIVGRENAYPPSLLARSANDNETIPLELHQFCYAFGNADRLFRLWFWEQISHLGIVLTGDGRTNAISLFARARQGRTEPCNALRRRFVRCRTRSQFLTAA